MNLTCRISFWTMDGRKAGLIGRTGSMDCLVKWSGRKIWPLLCGSKKVGQSGSIILEILNGNGEQILHQCFSTH